MAFQEIANALGLSVVTVEKAYQTGMRKIRAYLMKRKALRYELQDGLDMMESFKIRKIDRDVTFKGSDDA